MGCWNGTCAVSQLHIKHNDEVMVVVLERHTKLDSMCYSTSLYRPLLVPFYARYNDYGGGDECSGPWLEPIMTGIQGSLVEMEVGENEYHDIAVERDKFDAELFFEAVHENRLFVKGWDENKNVNFAMLRKDIVDHILDNWVQSDYVGDGKGNSGHDNAYVSYKFQDMLNDIPDFIAEVKNQIAEKSKIYGELDDPKFLRMMVRFENMFEFNNPNKVVRYIRNDSYRYSRLCNIGDTIMAAIMADDIHTVTTLLEDHLKIAYIDHFFHSTRRVWLPLTHQGSQSQDYDGYEVLISAVASAIQAEKDYYAADCDDGE